MRTKTKFLTFVVILLAGSQFAAAVDDELHRIIRVSGQGESSAPPDMATIQTGVTTQAKTAVAAMGENNTAVEKIMSDLKSMNVADKDMQTSQFSVQPVYDRGDRGQTKPAIVGYRVSNQLRVRVRNLPDLGKLLDTLIRSGSNQMSGISFGVDDPTTVMNEARTKAVANAKAKAELYAKAAGVAVGKVISIDEQQAVIPRPIMYGRGAMEMSASSVPIATGEQDFKVSINVTFELLDNE
jgi:uncharacterized protein YggE